MKSLRSILEDVLPNQQQDNTIELLSHNLIISVFEKEKKINMTPLNQQQPMTKARGLINQLKQQFKVSQVQQHEGNTFVITFDPRTEIGVVLDYLQNVTQ